MRTVRLLSIPAVFLAVVCCGNGREAAAYHGQKESWVFNRAMVWLDRKVGVDGAVICHSSQSPLLLTGRKQVSRWYVAGTDELADVDDQFTRFVEKDPNQASGNVSLPPFQFHVEQHPVAELEVTEATHPWRLSIALKGRRGPPLYESPWQAKPGKLSVDLLELYRKKNYTHHFPELRFLVYTQTKDPKQQATVVFRLRLNGRAAVIPSLPVIRMIQRAKQEGVPIRALVLDENAKRLGSNTVEVAASVGKTSVKLSESKNGIWKGVIRELPIGEHKVALRAVWKGDNQKKAVSNLDVHITDGQFVSYDRKLRLLVKSDKPIGPVTGSWRGSAMFKDIGTDQESVIGGQQQWEAARANKSLGSHAWESLTPGEIDADYAYLARCGWSVVHLCAGWSSTERLDAGGHIAPHGAEQLAIFCAAAHRHGLHVLFALSHYMIGYYTPPYAQYLEAGYDPGGQKGKFTGYSFYNNPKSALYPVFTSYLADFATVFRDEPAIFAYTAAGEGDVRCGKTFVNTVHDFMQAHDGNHLFICEPHHAFVKRPDFYQKDGWKPVLAGMRTYHIDRHPPESVAVQFRISAMSDVFMAEGLAWGWGTFKNANSNPGHYRRENRRSFYTALAYHNPAVITWGEQVVEDEQIVFEQVRKAVDWSKPFASPPLVLRVGLKSINPRSDGRKVLYRYEKALAKFPLECTYVWGDEPVPPGTLFTIDARQPFAEPAFVSAGGKLPEQLKAKMPLELPACFSANYSRSEDRQTFLAFIRKESEAKPASEVVLKNFPPGKLSYRLFDLAAKKIVREGRFEKTLTLKVPETGDDFFLLVIP